MNASAFLAVFPRQFRFWAFHCVLNALPSFCIALLIFNLGKSPAAVTAMLAAIGTFILLYATITSLSGPLSDEEHILSRSLKLGAKIRAWMVLVSLIPLAVVKDGPAFMPDFYCESAAMIAFGYATAPGFSVNDLAYGPPTDFLSIYVITIFSGIILSFFLLMISFFAVIFLQARDRKRVFAVADPG